MLKILCGGEGLGCVERCGAEGGERREHYRQQETRDGCEKRIYDEEVGEESY